MNAVKVASISETPEGIAVIILRGEHQFNYFKDHNGKEELWYEPEGKGTVPYASRSLLRVGRKAVKGKLAVDISTSH